MSAAGSLLGISGCIDNFTSRDGSSTAGNDVPGCTQTEEWTTDITTGPANPESDSIAGRHDCTNADRPEPTGDLCETFEVEREDGEVAEFHSAGVREYPDQPADFDDRTVQTFVAAYERAYTQNRAVSRNGKHTVEFSFTTHETTTIDEYDEIFVVSIEFGFAFRLEDGSGTGGYHDAFGEGALYGVDETGIVRIGRDNYDPDSDPEELPDPVEDGDLLQCF